MLFIVYSVNKSFLKNGVNDFPCAFRNGQI